MIHQIIKAFDRACLPMTGSWVSIHLTKSLVSLLMWQMVTVKNMPIWLVIYYSPRAIDRKYDF
jgi:hypothetical protein